MIIEQLGELRAELTEQSVPDEWQIWVISSMRDNPKRIALMMEWLKDNKEADYESMDLSKTIRRINKLIPMEPVKIEILY